MKIDIEVDPTNHYDDVSVVRIIKACGILPHWATTPDLFHLPLKEAMDEAYQFGLFEMEMGEGKSTIDDEGIHRFPEDPDMYPLVKITRGDETMYQYQSAIVCFIDKDSTKFLTRMD